MPSDAAGEPPPHNLPEMLTSFVDRGHELAQLRRLAHTARLVTLVGPGGVGKSRLALEAARQDLPRSRDGTWLVDFAGVTDSALLPREVASTLRMAEGPLRSLEDALERNLREQDLRLVFDNCEHVIDACAVLVERLLRACPRLRVLATSRQPLGIAGEYLIEVAPLAVPAAGERDARRLRANEAAQLFAERARAVRPDFALTEDQVQAVAAICRGLDGIPLALELAAVRLRTMNAAEIANGLNDRFQLLVGGSRTALPRHRTLRGMVDWSWELLTEPQCVLLRRLAVFAGGWTREAAEQVCADDALPPGEVNAGLSALVDRSLVVRDHWRVSARYRLLDTLRAYAGERLREAGEEAAVRRRHQAWCLGLLESGADAMQVDQVAWLSRLDAELDNVRAALDWCRIEPDTTERVLRASFGIFDYWDVRGHANESCQRFEELLALLPPGPPSAGRLAGQAFHAHALASRGDFERAAAALQATVAIAPEVDDATARFWCSMVEFEYLLFTGNPAAGEVGRALLAQQPSTMTLGHAVLPWFIGEAHLGRGELDEAERILRMAAETSTVERWRAYALDRLGTIAYRRGDPSAARAWFQQALASFARVREHRGRAAAVEHLACVAGKLEQWERAARLLGAAEMLYDLSSQVPYPPWQVEPQQIATVCRDHLGERAFAAAHAAGRSMSLDRAVQYALEPEEDRAGRRGGPSLLTRREREVAGLVAQGLTNRRIADTLVIGERTVESHISHLLAKLNLPSRASLAVWAAEQGLGRPAT